MTNPCCVQEWNEDSEREFVPPDETLYPTIPRVGLVIGTYAAVPYIHLQLEARKRFYPDVPLLVHDDGSEKRSELSELCREYGVDFEYNATRQPPCVGDLTAFVGGLWWAESRGLDILLKVSRRWIFTTNWEPSLQALALASQYATFCSYTTSFGFGFRTECLGMGVRAWNQGSFLRPVLSRIQEGASVFVEGYLHDFARQFEHQNCRTADRWMESHPMPPDRNGYALWTLLGTDRCERSPHFLWHDSAGPNDYFRLARDWNLPYQATDFADPNQGAGNGVIAA